MVNIDKSTNNFFFGLNSVRGKRIFFQVFNSGYYLFPLYNLLNWITLFCTLNLFGLFLPNIQN